MKLTNVQASMILSEYSNEYDYDPPCIGCIIYDMKIGSWKVNLHVYPEDEDDVLRFLEEKGLI